MFTHLYFKPVVGKEEDEGEEGEERADVAASSASATQRTLLLRWMVTSERAWCAVRFAAANLEPDALNSERARAVVFGDICNAATGQGLIAVASIPDDILVI